MTMREKVALEIVQAITSQVAYWRFTETDDDGQPLSRLRINVDGDIDAEALAQVVLDTMAHPTEWMLYGAHKGVGTKLPLSTCRAVWHGMIDAARVERSV